MTFWIALTVLVSVGCSSIQVPYPRRTREFETGEYSPKPAPSRGSLFPAGSRGLLEDVRPQSVGDVIIVRVEESDSALHDSSTRLSHEGEMNAGISGSVENLFPNAGLSQAIGMKTGQSMEGGGRISRVGRIKAMLPVRVKNVLPNGDLYVEGTKVVMVGNEQRALYVSGVVRPVDVLSDGSVMSTRIADAEISYLNRGDASDQEEQGWLAKVLKFVWPF